MPNQHRCSTKPCLRMPALQLCVAVPILLLTSAAVEAAHAELHSCGFEALESRTAANTRVLSTSRVTQLVNSERSLGITAQLADEVESSSDSSSSSGAPWQPLRIRVFTLDLDYGLQHCTKVGVWRPNFEGQLLNCTSDDVLTDVKKQTLEELLIPSAIQMHEDRLNVQRVDGNLVVDASSITSDTVCSQFTVPAEHTTTGVSDADFVLYLAAGPSTKGIWTTTCQTLEGTGRPSVGAINVAPRYISADPQTVRVITHELLHALGFNTNSFQEHGMYDTAVVRGKTAAPVLNSPNVVAQAQAQYGCPTQTFMELEDQGGSGTAFSHWKRRSAKDELMAGISGVGYYTALTIAAMEDMGFYRGNYDNAEPMSYGQNAGCSLTTSKCVVDGVTQFAEMFCDDASSTMVCTSDHTAVGYCDLTVSSATLPAAFEYFTGTDVGGSDALMDYCPYVKAPSSLSCSTSGGDLLGSVFEVNARCFNVPRGFVSDGDSNTEQRALCAAVKCGVSSYSVKVLGSSVYVICTPGSSLVLSNLSTSFSSGLLLCPSYNDVCVGRVNATAYDKYNAALKDGTAAAHAPAAAAFGVAVMAVAILAL